jgi:hypothetical protein
MKFIYLIFFFLILLSIITIIIYRKRNVKNSKDCIVSDWVYRKCDRTTGYVLKNREVISHPENGGKSCPPLEDKEECFDRDCKVGEWEDISGGCDRTTGILKKIRPIINDYVGKGTKCPPLEKEVDCPRDCKLTEWSDWSQCDKTIGKKTRKREVYLAQRDGGNGCPTNLLEEENCEKDCETGPWGVWQCDRTTGIKKRTRSVITPAIRGGDCKTEEIGECEKDCETGSWGLWQCDRTTGVRKRTRPTISPALRGGDCKTEEKSQCATNNAITSLTKTTQISGSACNPSPNKFSDRLTEEQINDTSYSYGVVNLNGIDGMFVKNGCRAKFSTNPGNLPIYCDSHDLILNYCIPKAEVFHVKKETGQINENEKESICNQYDSDLAKLRDLRTAIYHGADWCNPGLVSDPRSQGKVYFPNKTLRENCTTPQDIELSWSLIPGRIMERNSGSNNGVNCYGVKPTTPLPGHTILNFNQEKTSMYH